MNKNIVLSLLMLLTGCQTSKKATMKTNDVGAIVYLLPINVEVLLQKEIDKNRDQVYFCLYNDSSYYQIYVNPMGLKSKNPYVTKTNRKTISQWKILSGYLWFRHEFWNNCYSKRNLRRVFERKTSNNKVVACY